MIDQKNQHHLAPGRFRGSSEIQDSHDMMVGMRTKVLNYRIIVEKENQGSHAAYVAHAPSLGVSDFGPTVDTAVSNIEKAIKLYIETLIELNEPVPGPDTDDFYVTTKRIKLDSPVKA